MEDEWAHRKDLEHLKALQEKLKAAQEDLERHTEKMLNKTTGKK